MLNIVGLYNFSIFNSRWL